MIRVGRLFKSFGYAFKGLVKTFREEQNLQIQTLASLVALSLGVYFKITRPEWLVLILVIAWCWWRKSLIARWSALPTF